MRTCQIKNKNIHLIIILLKLAVHMLCKTAQFLCKNVWQKYFLGSATPCAMCISSSLALLFSNYSFLVHHLVNRDNRHLLVPGFIYKPKIPIWVNFGGPYLYWKMLMCFMAIWNILRTFEICYGHFVIFLFIWYIFSVFVSCTRKNLATVAMASLTAN
jgi:hypothetical protein